MIKIYLVFFNKQSEKGFSLGIVIGVAALILLGIVVASAPQIWNGLMPLHKPTVIFSSTPVPVKSGLSEKQQLYLRNKEAIKAELKMSDEQFALLVQGADKD